MDSIFVDSERSRSMSSIVYDFGVDSTNWGVVDKYGFKIIHINC